MQTFLDHMSRRIVLTAERRAHVLEHPEMQQLLGEIEAALASPAFVVQSKSDDTVSLYYRFLRGTLLGDKWLCVVVKWKPIDAFVLTAYLTDKRKQGVQLYP